MSGDILIRLATKEDLGAMEKIGDKLFDHPIKSNRAIEFFEDHRHHLVLAFHENGIVGMASGFHYVHPDKDPSMFINEVGVVDAFQNRGIGRKLVKFLWEYSQSIGCQEAWVGTEKSNVAAQRCYMAAGAEADDEPFVLYEFEVDQ